MCRQPKRTYVTRWQTCGQSRPRLIPPMALATTGTCSFRPCGSNSRGVTIRGGSTWVGCWQVLSQACLWEVATRTSPRTTSTSNAGFDTPKATSAACMATATLGCASSTKDATLLAALDAHVAHPGQFTGADLRPYWRVPAPACQRQAMHRRTIMRQARSKQNRALLLADLERRYLESS